VIAAIAEENLSGCRNSHAELQRCFRYLKIDKKKAPEGAFF
jgi:hypothetical protein